MTPLRSRTRIKGVCVICKKEISGWESAAFPVTGWEAERSSGGANRIINRKRRDNVVAHLVCLEHGINAKKLGELEGQIGLFEE